jgi:broad specificity phosphatase PhoE
VVEALVLRHAQSTWNASGRWQGQADPPLSSEGEAQVGRAASAVRPLGPFDLVISSDLTRAAATAQLLIEGLGWAARHVEEPLLREYDVGEWSGLDRAEIEHRWPGALRHFDAGRLNAPPGGESRSSFDARVKNGLSRVEKLCSRAGVRRILMVVHGGVIRSMMRTSGHAEAPIPHLCGYRGAIDRAALHPVSAVDLLGTAGPAPASPNL